MPKYFIQGALRPIRGREFIAVVIAVIALSMLSDAARAGCCDAGGPRGGGWVWRPVGWSWGAGVWWRAEGPGAPLWGYETCYRPRQVWTPRGLTWLVVRVC